MKIAKYRIQPGGKGGQLEREQKLKLGNDYVELLKQTEKVIDVIYDENWITIKMEDNGS